MVAIAQIRNHTPMATTHDSGWILIAVEYTTHCYVDFGRTTQKGGTFICFGAHSNLQVLLLGYDDRNYTTVFYICIRTCNHAPMATAHGSGWILIAVDYTTHCYVVDFGRTARTSICFGAHSNLHVLLLGYDGRNYTPVCYICIHTCNHTPMATAHGSELIYMQLLCNGDDSRLRILILILVPDK